MVRKDRILPRIPVRNTSTYPIFHQFTPRVVENFLIAFGDDEQPLPETIKVLDEIVTDYIIESCHEAASVATHARRAKIKLDDFKFMLRRDTTKLGRVSEMLEKEKELKRSRKIFDTDEGAIVKGADKSGDKENGGDGGDKEPSGGGAGDKKGGKARSVGGRTDGGIGGDDERRKKKRKKTRDSGGGDARSVTSR